MRPFNLAYDIPERQPAAVALCAGEADVATAINWARDNGVQPVPRSGGHSYAGYSMTPNLLVDVSLMRAAKWDNARTELTVEAGARNYDVYRLLCEANRTMTHGRCGTRRRHRLQCAPAWLGGRPTWREPVVTADSRTLDLSADENDDLFWACRGGGGGNFGINTEFTLNTVPASPVTVFNIDWQGPREGIAKVADQLMQQVLDPAPPTLGSRFSLRMPKPGTSNAAINLLGQLDGPRSDAEALLRPVLRTEEIEELSYSDGQVFLLERDGPGYFLERSAFWRGR